ncbi:MAG: tetratricopeptide repeat protein [Rudaea sp.]
MTDRTVPDLLARGQRLLQAGDKVGAHSFFSLATESEPGNEQAWMLRAESAVDPQEAAECLEQALALNPKNSQAHQDLTYSRVHKLRTGLRFGGEEPGFFDSRVGHISLFSTAALVTVVVVGSLLFLFLRARGTFSPAALQASAGAVTANSNVNEPLQSTVLERGSVAINTVVSPTPILSQADPATEFPYVLFTETAHASCSGWVVSGHVRDTAGQAVNGVTVQASAADSASVATAVTGNTSALENSGYWEFVFPANSDVRGKIELLGPSGQPVSAAVPFHLTGDCTSADAANWIEIEFRKR